MKCFLIYWIHSSPSQSFPQPNFVFLILILILSREGLWKGKNETRRSCGQEEGIYEGGIFISLSLFHVRVSKIITAFFKMDSTQDLSTFTDTISKMSV